LLSAVFVCVIHLFYRRHTQATGDKIACLGLIASLDDFKLDKLNGIKHILVFL